MFWFYGIVVHQSCDRFLLLLMQAADGTSLELELKQNPFCPCDSTNKKRKANNSIVKIVHCIIRNNNIITMLSNSSPQQTASHSMHFDSLSSSRVWNSVGSTPDLKLQYLSVGAFAATSSLHERLLCWWSIFSISMNQTYTLCYHSSGAMHSATKFEK